MARLMNFRTLVAESLEEGDAMKFKDVIREKLSRIYIKQQKGIVRNIREQSDPETAMVVQVESASKSYGAKNFIYDQGVLTITVPNGQAALNLSSYLDENDNVDSYEISKVGEFGEDGATDLEKLSEGEECDYEVTVYFNTDNVRFEAFDITEMKDEEDEDEDDESDDEDEDDESDDEDDDEDTKDEGKKCKKKSMTESFEEIDYREWLDEVERITTFRAGLKKIKMQCPPGQKWNPATKKCVKMSSAENRMRHMKGIIAAKKRAPKQGLITKRLDKTLAKRAAAGY